MKRTLQTVLVMSFLAMILISPVAAATTQGLEWGVAQNDEFTYRLRMVDEGVQTYDEGMNITVTGSTPALSDPLTTWLSIPVVLANMVYTNGTPAIAEAVVIGFASILVGGVFIVPIGNFSLLADLAAAAPWWTVNHTIVSDSAFWGIRLSYMDDDSPSQIYVQYSKSNGVCARFNIESTNSTSHKKSSFSLVRDGLGLDIVQLLQDNILYVGIGVGVIVILGAVVCIRRR
ncbi:MAG: hypothetical protein EAX87_03475 [Candidatus Thorarchaeota archaeon]|nr:hypothetical protein [Candidatus Thorarchaeota archaeon]